MGKLISSWNRSYGHSFTWLIAIWVGTEHGFGGGGRASGYPVAEAVVDDFGNLVIVGKWS